MSDDDRLMEADNVVDDIVDEVESRLDSAAKQLGLSTENIAMRVSNEIRMRADAGEYTNER